ncbi:MAG: hypothetical protein OJF61_000304 [Rhodanobacteraceae bacterium]|nr:MAG: hypothetical protein OJF61_000304 [Rhodanobacteraceae bacterium]
MRSSLIARVSRMVSFRRPGNNASATTAQPTGGHHAHRTQPRSRRTVRRCALVVRRQRPRGGR